MTTIIVVLWALFGFAAGAVLFGELSPLFGIRNMEGNAAYFGMLVGGAIGTIGGAIAGLLLRPYFNADPRRRRYAIVASLAVLIGVPLSVWTVETWRSHDHLTTRPNSWGLGIQVRLPAGEVDPAGQKIGIELRSAKENLACPLYNYPHGLTREGDRFVISGDCPLFCAQPQRSILVRIGDRPTIIFNVRIKARPEAATYSNWFGVDEVYDNVTGKKRAPRPDENYDIRYGAR